MTSDCLFCKIVTEKIPADIVYQDDQVVAFRDISPQAPTHILIIPRKHISTINEIESTDQQLVGYLVLTAQKLAEAEGISESGFRLVMNCNQDGGQTVYHIHMHLMGGRQLTVLG
ncbi:MAG: histidine triad (HIT) family protein [Candidatus Azotimanducaceae bacterium]|jgi:histidine triad (HIT) family protein